MRERIFSAGFLLAMLSISAFGQASSELEKRYGAPKLYSEGAPLAYEIRPGLFLRVEYAEDGQACEMLIEELQQREPNTDRYMALSKELVKAIIDELIPVAGRGKEINPYGFTFWLGQAGTTEYGFENVSVTGGNVLVTEQGKRREKMQGSIFIRWKSRPCKRK